MNTYFVHLSEASGPRGRKFTCKAVVVTTDCNQAVKLATIKALFDPKKTVCLRVALISPGECCVISR